MTVASHVDEKIFRGLENFSGGKNLHACDGRRSHCGKNFSGLKIFRAEKIFAPVTVASHLRKKSARLEIFRAEKIFAPVTVAAHVDEKIFARLEIFFGVC